MDKIVEMVPDDLPEWAQEAFDEGQFFRVAVAKVAELKAQVAALENPGSDLIERLKAVELDDPQAIDALLVECITALSPTLPDDVAELAAWLDEYTADDPMHSAVNSHYKLRRILKMLERQARQIIEMQTYCDETATEKIELHERIEELEAQVKKLEREVLWLESNWVNPTGE